MTLSSPLPPDASFDELVFVCSDAKKRGRLARVIQRAVGPVRLADSVRQLHDYVDGQPLVAIHYDGLAPQERTALLGLLAERPDLPTVLLSSHCEQDELAALFGARALTHLLVVHEAGPDLDDLLTTVEKLRRREIFGLEKYFGWGVSIHQLYVAHSSERRGVIDRIEDFAEEIRVPSRLRGLLATVADEFLTNAMYNAPVTAEGLPRYLERSRRDPVVLDIEQRVTVKFCCDGRRFGLSTIDPFGTLAPERVQDYLARGYRKGDDQISETSGGAGLGLYQIMDSLSHFVINIEKGRRTEMIGLVDVDGTYRRFRSTGKSFNMFVLEDR
jgi:anti-sigma regulatory factor (Ser/Thr protein kinase)